MGYNAGLVSDPTPAPAPETRVFERKVPWWFKVVLPLTLLGPPFVPLLVLNFLDVDELVDAFELSVGPVGSLAVGGTFLGGFVLLISLFGVLVAVGRRRFGKCEISGDLATFHLLWIPPIDMKVSVALAEIGHRTETPWGLILTRKKKKARFPALLFPLFVPTHSEAETAEAVALLDREEAKTEGEEAVSYGRKQHRKLIVPLVAVYLAAILVPLVILGVRFGFEGITRTPQTLVVFGVVISLMLFEIKVVTPFYGELAVGSTSLLVRTKRFDYADLTLLAKAPPFLAYQVGKRKKLAWLGDDLPTVSERLDAALEAQGLDLRVQPEAPPWASPAGRRRTAAVLVAANAVVFAVVLGLSFTTSDVYESEELCDDDGNYLRVVYRLGDKQPRFLLLVEDDRGPPTSNYFLDDTTRVPGLWNQSFGFKNELEIDMVAGRVVDPHGTHEVPLTTRTLQLRPEDGLTFTSDRSLPANLGALVEEIEAVSFRPGSVPEALEPLLPGLEDPLLEDFITGRSSRRYYDVADGDGLRLICGVDRGEAKVLVVAPAAAGFQIYLNGHHDVVGAGGNKDLFAQDLSFSRLRSDGTYQAATQPLPEFEAMLELIARVRAGASIRAEVAALAPDLFE